MSRSSGYVNVECDGKGPDRKGCVELIEWVLHGGSPFEVIMETQNPAPELLKAIRVNHLELTQAELAACLGVHKRTIAAWEQGDQKAPRYVELALCELERRLCKKD